MSRHRVPRTIPLLLYACIIGAPATAPDENPIADRVLWRIGPAFTPGRPFARVPGRIPPES